jgi:hypothetical protein
MSWEYDIEKEISLLRNALRSGNAGQARVCARRAAGIALAQLDRRFPGIATGTDAMGHLRTFAEVPDLPEDVRAAARHLTARLSPDFTAASSDPLRDAEMIVEYVKRRS